MPKNLAFDHCVDVIGMANDADLQLIALVHEIHPRDDDAPHTDNDIQPRMARAIVLDLCVLYEIKPEEIAEWADIHKRVYDYIGYRNYTHRESNGG